MLFAYKFILNVLEEFFPVQVADGDVGVFVHDDAQAGYFLYFFQIDNVGTVYPHEKVFGQAFFQFFQAEQDDERFGFVFQVNAEVFAHAFDVAYGRDVYFYNPVIGFKE